MSPASHKTWRASKLTQASARRLREEMTPAERKLWHYLRNRQLDGAFFRSQHPVGPYIVDFICTKSGLVIEIDGDTHFGRETMDAERTHWLEEYKNYRVIRFTNRDVLECIEAVIEEIQAALQREES
jgi:very-short-patch-repair endonuclease